MFEWVTRFDLLCFDFDGLLVNTEDLHYEAYKQMLLKRGYHLPWSFQAYCLEAHVSTAVLRNAIYGLFPDLEREEPRWETLRQEKQQIYQQLLSEHRIKLMEGVPQLLHTLNQSQTKACVVTNSTTQQVDEIRNLLPQLNSINHWITRELYENPKPKPDGYLLALERLADPSDRIVGFEDTMKGIHSLVAANISPVLIRPPSYPPLQVPCDIPTFSSFLEIRHLDLKLMLQ